MSSNENTDVQDHMHEDAEETVSDGEDTVANKLSKELSNWRLRRHSAKPRRLNGAPAPTQQPSGPARTIRVRGHETLVVRKAKLAPKPAAPRPQDQD